MATAALGIPMMDDRNEDPHRKELLNNKLTAADWINSSECELERNPLQAQTLISSGLQLEPGMGAGYFNLGLALHQQARPTAAIRAYRLALRYANGDDLVRESAKRNLAQDLLLTGNFNEGWNCYEERLKQSNYGCLNEKYGEPWQGINDPRSLRRLVLVAEQGLGDTLMFSRLGLDLQEKLKCPVTLQCQKPLVKLLQRYSALDEVIEDIKEIKANSTGQLWCPLMSLPQKIELVPTQLKHRSAYISLDSQAVKEWEVKLGRRNGHKLIGLHWQGNPKHEGSLYSRGRSIKFNELSGLKKIKGVEYVSVQKGAGSEQLEHRAGLNFVRGQNEVSASMDFIDTACVLANCDLLITADSGVAHLAGALGIRTWLLLCFVPEWRWGMRNTTTPWYPSMKIFRQTKYGEWATVINSMVKEWNMGKES